MCCGCYISKKYILSCLISNELMDNNSAYSSLIQNLHVDIKHDVTASSSNIDSKSIDSLNYDNTYDFL
jgi:hypothetical protein